MDFPTTAEKLEPVFFENSLKDAIERSEKTGKDIFILGGAAIYEHALEMDVVDKIIASEVKGVHEGDAYFPELKNKWDLQLIKEYDRFSVIEYIRNIE